MPSFDTHIQRLNESLRSTIRDRITEAARLSRDGRVCGFDAWVTEPELDGKASDQRIRVMAQDEGGCQIYVKFKPKKTAGAVRWAPIKRVPLLHLSEPELLTLKGLIWYPNDPESPLVVLARCAN